MIIYHYMDLFRQRRTPLAEGNETTIQNSSTSVDSMFVVLKESTEDTKYTK